jgi:hypothetical protein
MKNQSITLITAILLIFGLAGTVSAASLDVTTEGITITGTEGIKNDQGHFVTVPSGAIFMFPTETPPGGYLECNGAPVSRTTYAKLFAVLGTRYGAVDGLTFNLPDMRGQFVRGWDHGAGVDIDAVDRSPRADGVDGDVVGSTQTDEFENHEHTTPLYFFDGATPRAKVRASYNAYFQSNAPTSSVGGNETRPKNINLMFCIKY